MGVVAILVMRPRYREQTFVPLNYWGSIWNLALIGQVVFEKKTVEEFSLYEYVKQVTPGRGHFLPQSYIWTIFIEVHKMKLHTKYQRHVPSSFRQEDFFDFFL